MPIAEDPEPRPSEGREPDGTAPSGPDGKDPFADLVLDEEFVQGASVKEQAGRTRMLAAQWKHTPPVDPGGRRSVNDGPAPKKRFARKARPADPWGNPRPRRSPEWRTPLFVLLAVAVVLAALNVDGLRNWYEKRTGGDSASAAPVEPVAPATAPPTTAPPQADPKQPTVDRPWAGSPAEGWPTSITVFEPKEPPAATGVFTAQQVADQVKLVKEYLAATNLDPKVVAGGRPEAALAMLDPETRQDAEKALAKPSRESDPTSWFSRFDARDAIPVGDTYRLQGWITVEGDGKRGVLVHTDFTFVYPVRPGPDAAKRAMAPKPSRPPGPSGAPAPTGPGAGDGAVKPVGLLTPVDDVAGDTWTARTLVRRIATFRFYDPAKYDVERGKIYFESNQSDVANSECDVDDGYYHPQFDQFAAAQAPNPNQSGPTSDPYDLTQPPDPSDVCGTVSRS